MLEIILVVLALLAIVGASIYFYVDMKDHKATNNNDFEKINKNIETEEKTRLGNIKYVVDQVNTTNQEMDKEYNERLVKLEEHDTGFNNLISAESSTGALLSMREVTPTNASKLRLMKDVSVIGSMSIKDLQIATSIAPAKTFKACGKGSGVGATEKCIEFPNSEGDTYLTAFGSDKSVVSGSKFKANAGLLTDTINNLGTGSNVTISAGTTGNTITVSNSAENGITLMSGNSTIEIKNGGVNINNANGLSGIKLNGRILSESVIPIPDAVSGDLTLAQLTTAFAGKKVLTLDDLPAVIT